MQATRLANGTERPTAWIAVDWQRANRVVRNLRWRIFRATQAGDWNKVRSLQQLMLRSYSNRLVSVRRVTQTNAGKETPGVDKVVVKTPEERGKLVDDLAARRALIRSQTHASPRLSQGVRRATANRTRALDR